MIDWIWDELVRRVKLKATRGCILFYREKYKKQCEEEETESQKK